MNITGNKVTLRPARLPDRRKSYIWLACSDITSSVMGPPHFPEFPVPTWKEFCREYPRNFFSASGDGRGRNYIIRRRGEEVGIIGYDLLDQAGDRVVLDIWMRAEKYCGRGYGSDALDALCRFIHKEFGITQFIISPSARNQRAIQAYQKAGFALIKSLSKEDQIDAFGVSEYSDNLLMIKRIPAGQTSGDGSENLFF